MSETRLGDDWWIASDGRWYPPQNPVPNVVSSALGPKKRVDDAGTSGLGVLLYLFAVLFILGGVLAGIGMVLAGGDTYGDKSLIPLGLAAGAGSILYGLMVMAIAEILKYLKASAFFLADATA